MIGITVGLLALAVIEAFYFYWILQRPSHATTYDAIVVFAGSNNRIEHAFQLAREEIAPTVIVSPAGRRTLHNYEKQFGPPGDAAYILEPRADTTFMNAHYTAQLIRKHSLKSVLLVTSDYHMPRSYVLLKLATLGSGCRIGFDKVPTRFSKKGDSRFGSMDKIRLTYNEMVQLWGSLAEGGLHRWGGGGKRVNTRSSGLLRWMRSHLLFDVGCSDCKGS
jgi:uncharacterized SAM-binding protein YcdF (DUF218 family)